MVEEEKKAVWVDEDDETFRVDLNKRNRLKKLKKGEESVVTGSEYQSRLRDQYAKIHTQSDIYNWAYDSEKKETTDDTGNEVESLLKTNKPLLNSDFKKDCTLL